MALSSMMHASRVCFGKKKTSSSASDSDLDLLVVLLRVVILVVVFVTMVLCVKDVFSNLDRPCMRLLYHFPGV